MCSTNDTRNQIPTVLEGCHCPVSSVPSGENGAWKHIAITDIDEHLVEGSRLYGSPDAFLRAAWHTLLKTYIGEDTTSFASLHCGKIDCHSKAAYCKDNFQAAEQSSIWLYHSLSDGSHQSLQRGLEYPLCDGNIEKSNLNTAIYICSASLNETYAHWLQSPHCYDEAHLFDVILLVNQITHVNKLNFCFRCPRVPFSYGQTVADSLRSILVLLSCKTNRSGCQDLVLFNVQTIQKWQPKSILKISSCVHNEIFKVADVMPSQEAVCAWDGSMTYRELLRLSNIVAKHLVKAGLSLGSFIPFVFEKSVLAVVAALGIIQAGGALVPLNPDHPKGRRERILEDIDATIAVTSQSHSTLFKGSSVNVITVSSENVSRWAKENTTTVHLPQVSSQDPIFVLFTSGSTGEPKGMVHEHGGICSHATGQIQTMGYRGARVFQFSAFTFDVAMMDIFTTLMAGGCVCVPSETERTGNMAGAMQRMKVDHALLTPSIAALLHPRDVPGLRVLTLAGESLGQSVIDTWVDHVWLMNAYGPAEVGVCTVSNVDRDTHPKTIGLPLSHTFCWVVNRGDHDQLVPVGAVGELLVAGTTIARGYLNNKKKSKASFIRAPRWANQFGAQDLAFYKTGDLVRYNINTFDGSLDYIGRKDTQVKIRGQRVELGDIEHYLATFPGVLRSIVSFPREGYYAGSLVDVLQIQAGLEMEPNGPLSLDDQHMLEPDVIRKHLASSLMHHMIPTEYLIIRSLPLDPSCKIDRKRVNQWLTTFFPTFTKCCKPKFKVLAPFHSSETIARAISDKICTMLLPKIAPSGDTLHGRDFTLSGLGLDSIQLMSISMHLKKKYHVLVSISDLNSPHATVRGLAKLVKEGKADETLPSVNVMAESNSVLKMLSKLTNLRPVEALKAQFDRHNVFLTGASGFLGHEILRQLLLRPNIHIVALIRCLSSEEGLQRLRSLAVKNGWWHEAFASRLHIWPGDLSESQLGLPFSAREKLSGRASESDNIHVIIHCGARVQYNYDYTSLKAANVDSTAYLLEMAAQSSSIGSFLYVSGGLTPNTHQSDGPTEDELASTNGYTQSKLVSELIVRECARHSAFQRRVVRIIRPGYIIGSAARPTAVQTDFIWRLVAACLRMESYNGDASSQWLYIADVERVAQLIVSAIIGRHEATITDAVWDGLPVREFWNLLTAEFGYNLRSLDQVQWLEKLRLSIAREEESHPLFPFLHVLEQELESIGSAANFDLDSTPVLDAIRSNIRNLISTGFLPPPPPPSSSGYQHTRAIENGHSFVEIINKL